MFFNPPLPHQNPPIYGKRYRSFQNHWDAFGLNTFQFFSFSHQSWWKIISRNTIPDMKRYLFAMKFIFKHIFGHFFENEWKGQNTIQSRPQEKKYVFILRKFKCSIFLYQQYYAYPNVSTISQPPPWHYLLLLFPVVVNSYVKPIGPLLSPLFLQKSNPIDFQDRYICWSVVTPFLKLSETFEKDWTGHLPKGHLILMRSLLRKSTKRNTSTLKKWH